MNIFNFLKNNKPVNQVLGNCDSAGIKEISEAISNVIDPETGVDIVSLGLIYGINIENGNILIKMTMTTPACPMSSYLGDMTKENVIFLPGVNSIEIDLVWQPVWSVQMMSNEAKNQLGWD